MSDLKADASWFHVFRAMMDSGDVAAMGPHAFTVYCIIKGHANFSTGNAWPGLETIAEKSGISERQIIRELKMLEDLGYVSKARVGRSNQYTLREKFVITDSEGQTAAVATWDYLPNGVRAAMADLRNVIVTGDLGGAKVVHIDRMTINSNYGDNSVNLNIGTIDRVMADIERLPDALREKVLRAYKGSKGGPVDN